MAAKKSPTARSLEALKAKGWPAQVVERWLPGRRAKKGGEPGETEATPYGVRKDLFGCIDIVALDGQPGSLGVQACAGGDVATRAKKAAAEPLALPWLQAGNRLQVWGWREVWVDTSPKTRAKRWKVRIVELFVVDGPEVWWQEVEPVAEGAKASAPSGAGVGARAATSLNPGRLQGGAPGLFDDLETA